MFLSHHQTLHPSRTSDQHVVSGLQPRLESASKDWRRPGECRNVEARDQALPVIQRAQSVNATLKADCQMQIPRLGEVLLQHLERDVMAGLH